MTDAVLAQRYQTPPEVLALAHRLGAKTDCERATVRLTQTGRMRANVEARWMQFTASQSISPIHCAFDWRAHTGLLGTEWISDRLENGEGKLSVKALGLIPMAQFKPSAALTRGQLIRYLAELPLVPDAILCNDWLLWQSLSPDTLTVSAGTGDKTAEVVFTLDSDGRVATVFSPDRPRDMGQGFKQIPWRGSCSDYRFHKGRWLPFAAEVAWEVDGAFPAVWEGRMESWSVG